MDAIVADAPDEIWSLVSVDPALEPGAVLVAEGTDDAVAFIALTDDTMRRAIALKLPHAPSVRVGDRLVAAADGRVARAPDGAADLLGATVRAEDVLRACCAANAAGPPLFAQPPALEDRQSIGRNLHTGVAAIDALVPIGEGQSLLIVGEAGSHKTSAALDCLAGAQRGRDEEGTRELTCVYACASLEADRIRTCGGGTAILVTHDPGAEEGKKGEEGDEGEAGARLAATLAAVALAERARDAGGDAVVFLDDLRGLSRFWERANARLLQLDAELAPPSLSSAEGEAKGKGEGEAMVEMDGTLLAKGEAMRRQFMSSVLQRSARMSDALGGGTLTLIGLIPGPFRASEDLRSIADGHVCVERVDAERYVVRADQSLSRLGVGRVATPEAMDMCMGLQNYIVQAADARAFGCLGEEEGRRLDRVNDALTQTRNQPLTKTQFVALMESIQAERNN